jgi:5-methylcytosine-specific restriction endonuclease McrA
MHNFTKSDVSIEDNLKDVKRNLQSPKKEFFASKYDILRSCLEHYDAKGERDELHTLSPLLIISPDDSSATRKQKTKWQKYANELYGSSRTFVNNHWERLKVLNGGETLMCPICGLTECEEMDHYVPREIKSYPEYSSHLSNLIPLCHKCNHDKSIKFLNEAGERIFFNAFYDILNNREILTCVIELDKTEGLPYITINISPSLDSARKPDKYILSTIDELKLIPRFKTRAKQLFKKELVRLEGRKDKTWETICTDLASAVDIPADDPDIVYYAVIKAMINSDVLKCWYDSLT